MPMLGVNIDHVATLRQARGVLYPDPVSAVKICEEAGCDSIVCHLREDRRHINDNDVFLIKDIVKTRLNLEMSIAKEIVDIACKLKPDQVTLVPEKREEITTEGGLDVRAGFNEIRSVVKLLSGEGIEVSLFIDPEDEALNASFEMGIKIIEFHTGKYANAVFPDKITNEIENIKDMTQKADEKAITVNAGHGLNYDNVGPIARMANIHELNIGHSIISYAVLWGLEAAVRKMKELTVW